MGIGRVNPWRVFPIKAAEGSALAAKFFNIVLLGEICNAEPSTAQLGPSELRFNEF